MEKRKALLVLALCIIIATASAVLAAVTLYYSMPMSASIKETASIETYIDGAPVTNDTEVPWGMLEPGEIKQKTIEIKNTGNTILRITFSPVDLPMGWDLTYDRNGSLVNPSAWLNGTLTLTVPESVSVANYYWQNSIFAESQT